MKRPRSSTFKLLFSKFSRCRLFKPSNARSAIFCNKLQQEKKKNKFYLVVKEVGHELIVEGKNEINMQIRLLLYNCDKMGREREVRSKVS